MFIDGVPGKGGTPEDKAGSVMKYQCARYPGESHYYIGEFMPGAANAQAEDIVEMLLEKVCFNTRKVAGHLDRCKVYIDLFGFSRGGATAVRVAHRLNEEFKCSRCGVEDQKFLAQWVRFLGIIDPDNTGMKMWPFFVWKEAIPDNVAHYFVAYSDKGRKYHEYYRVPKFPLGHTKKERWHEIEHGPIGVAREAPEKRGEEPKLKQPLIDLLSEYAGAQDTKDFSKDEIEGKTGCETPR